MTQFKSKISIVLGLAITAIIAIIVLIVYPALQNIQKISQDIEEQRISLETKYQRGQSLKKATEDYQNLKEKLPQLDQMFIIEGEELVFITTLEDLAMEHGLTQQIQLLTDGQKIDPKIQSLPLTLNLAGDFPQIIKYLIALEQLDYYFAIDSVSFKNTDQPSSSTNSVTTYFLENKGEMIEEMKKIPTASNVKATFNGSVYLKLNHL